MKSGLSAVPGGNRVVGTTPRLRGSMAYEQIAKTAKQASEAIEANLRASIDQAAQTPDK